MRCGTVILRRDFSVNARPPAVPFYGRSLRRDRAANKIPDGDLIALNQRNLVGGEATRLSEAENDGRCALCTFAIFPYFFAKNASPKADIMLCMVAN